MSRSFVSLSTTYPPDVLSQCETKQQMGLATAAGSHLWLCHMAGLFCTGCLEQCISCLSWIRQQQSKEGTIQLEYLGCHTSQKFIVCFAVQPVCLSNIVGILQSSEAKLLLQRARSMRRALDAVTAIPAEHMLVFGARGICDYKMENKVSILVNSF